jgi:predicted transcriptional regulator
MANDRMERALGLLGPLEARLMRAIWTDSVQQPFVVRDLLETAPGLAYTTVMTTLNRLAAKGLLSIDDRTGQRAYHYRTAATPDQFLVQVSREHVDRLFEQFGESIVPALVERLRQLDPDHLEPLRELCAP